MEFITVMTEKAEREAGQKTAAYPWLHTNQLSDPFLDVVQDICVNSSTIPNVNAVLYWGCHPNFIVSIYCWGVELQSGSEEREQSLKYGPTYVETVHQSDEILVNA